MQVTKEEKGNKNFSLTTYVALSGRYCVFMPHSPQDPISRRVTDPKERDRLRKIVADYSLVDYGGVALRASAAGRSAAELLADHGRLLSAWKAIHKSIWNRDCVGLVSPEIGVADKAVRDLYSDEVRLIVVEGEQHCARARDYAQKMIGSEAAAKVQLYSGGEGLFHSYGIESEVQMLTSRHVPLKSGGSLVIDVTEALVSVDVNSGKMTRKTNKVEETAHLINMEAACGRLCASWSCAASPD